LAPAWREVEEEGEEKGSILVGRFLAMDNGDRSGGGGGGGGMGSWGVVPVLRLRLSLRRGWTGVALSGGFLYRVLLRIA